FLASFVLDFLWVVRACHCVPFDDEGSSKAILYETVREEGRGLRAGSRLASHGAEAEAGGQNDERDPDQIGAEQMKNLHGERRKQSKVGDSERVLRSKEHGQQQSELAVGRGARSGDDERQNKGAGKNGCGRVQPAEAKHPVAVRGKILKEGGAQAG